MKLELILKICFWVIIICISFGILIMCYPIQNNIHRHLIVGVSNVLLGYLSKQMYDLIFN